MEWLWVALALLAIVAAYALLRRREAPAQAPPVSPGEPPSAEPRRRKRRELATGPTEVRGALPAVVADMQDDSPGAAKARGKHYAFAHGLLRQAQRDHGKWLRLSAAARAGTLDELLETLWSEIPNEQNEAYGGPPSARAIDDGVLIRMPDVVAPGEALYVALVERDGDIRYFTLDKTARGFAVREWTEETHVDHGPAEDEQEAFLTEVARVLSRPGE